MRSIAVGCAVLAVSLSTPITAQISPSVATDKAAALVVAPQQPRHMPLMGAACRLEGAGNGSRNALLGQITVRAALLAGLLLAVQAVPAAAEVVTGPVQVIDGDTLEVQGRRVRLFGIDAPELSQSCDRNGESWTCGQASAEQLRSLIGSHAVTCEGNQRDTYNRLLAVCSLSGVSLNRTMVAEGWATAFRRYSEDYVADETRARAGRLGLWSSSFASPEDHRMAEDAAAARQVPQRATGSAARSSSRANEACLIKGNRNSRGEWIYHLPGRPYYAQTRAEQMFCSEAEAVAAGYRRSKA